MLPTNKAGTIVNAFWKNRDVMLKNMLSSFQLMVPAIVISLAFALTVGTIMGMNKKIRKVMHPVIYTISVVPSILMAPFALLLAPSFRAASLFLVIYGTVWSTLFAAIPNFTIHEHHVYNRYAYNKQMCIYDYQPENGYFAIPDRPGIGNELSEYCFTHSQLVTIQ